MAEILPLLAIVGTGVVVFQALKAKTGHEKHTKSHKIRMEQSNDKEFRTRGMFQLNNVPATVIHRNGSSVTVNVLGQNHTITAERLDELVRKRHLIVNSAEKPTSVQTPKASALSQKMMESAKINSVIRRPDQMQGWTKPTM